MHRENGHAPGTENHHRITWFVRDLKHHLVPLPRRGQGHLPLEHLIQADLEHFPGWSILSLSVQLGPVPHRSHKEEFPSNI